MEYLECHPRKGLAVTHKYKEKFFKNPNKVMNFAHYLSFPRKRESRYSYHFLATPKNLTRLPLTTEKLSMNCDKLTLTQFMALIREFFVVESSREFIFLEKKNLDPRFREDDNVTETKFIALSRILLAA